MEMLSSFGGDKHEFCLVVIKAKHVYSCPSRTSEIIRSLYWHIGHAVRMSVSEYRG